MTNANSLQDRLSYNIRNYTYVMYVLLYSTVLYRYVLPYDLNIAYKDFLTQFGVFLWQSLFSVLTKFTTWFLRLCILVPFAILSVVITYILLFASWFC
jgi:hypothetical protein